MAQTEGRQLPPPRRAKIWDLGTRVFHWALVFCFTTSFLLGEFGPAIMTLHFWSGYIVTGLLLFRLLWGLLGPRPVRFTSFVYGPAAMLRYLWTFTKRAPSNWPGHNPLGGLSVIAMLLLLGAQVTTGMLSDPEDYINVGLLAHLVTIETNRTANAWHELTSNALLILVAMHVAVILFYRIWKHEDLIGPMIHGWKTIQDKCEFKNR